MCTTYSECVFVALDIQLAMHMRRIVVCCLSGCTIFFHIISYMERFSENEVTESKMCFELI